MANYVYWSTQRPIGIGTCPKDGLVRFHNYHERTPIYQVGETWGYVVYNRELSLKEVCDYELTFAGTEGDEIHEQSPEKEL